MTKYTPEVAAARLEVLENFVADLAEHGLRADLNPTANFQVSADQMYTWFSTYMRGADKILQTRAREVLQGPSVPTEPLHQLGSSVRIKATGEIGTIVDGGTATPLDYVLAIVRLERGRIRYDRVEVSHGEVEAL